MNYLHTILIKRAKIFPLDNLGGNITSLAINPIKNDSILVTTLSGSLIEISLPKTIEF